MSEELKTLAILFSDVKSFSTLDNDEKNVLYKELKDIEATIKQSTVTTKSSGDGLIITMENPIKLAEFALNFRDRFRRTHWHGKDISRDLEIRIALHYGSVTIHYDDNGEPEDVMDRNMDFTARIEPITKENEVFCSEKFFNKLHYMRTHKIIAKNLGEIELAKNYGKSKLYKLSWKYEEENINLQEKIDKYEKELIELKDEASKLDKEKSDYSIKIGSLEKEIDGLNKKLEIKDNEQKEKIDKYEKELIKLKDEVLKLDKEKSDYSIKIGSLEKEIDELTVKNSNQLINLLSSFNISILKFSFNNQDIEISFNLKGNNTNFKNGEEIKIFKVDEEITIGRAKDNDIIIDDSYVSEKHAYFNYNRGVFINENNNQKSLNGIFIVNKKIEEKQELIGGEVILIGKSYLLIEIE